MPAFDAKTLDSDPDGLAVLSAILHPTRRAQADAVRRGRERLAQAGSMAEAMARKPGSQAGCCCGADAPAG